MGTIVLAVVASILALMIGMQLVVRLRARALEGKPLPAVPGALGSQLASLDRALVYFMSPQCGACRRWTPKLTAISRRRRDVFVIDVLQHLEVARALGVMATPSTIEVQQGHVVGYHVGIVPEEVLGRFG